MLNPEQLEDDTLSLESHQPTQSIDFGASRGAYYYGGQWGQCLEWLQHLCEHNQSIFLVTGKPGIGKTALKHALQEVEAARYQFCCIDDAQFENVSDFMQTVASGFDVTWEESLLQDLSEARSFQDIIYNQTAF